MCVCENVCMYVCVCVCVCLCVCVWLVGRQRRDRGRNRHSSRLGQDWVGITSLLPPLSLPLLSFSSPSPIPHPAPPAPDSISLGQMKRAKLGRAHGRGSGGLSRSGPLSLLPWVPEHQGLQLQLLLFNQLVAI